NTVLVTATVSPSPRPTQTVTSTVTASPQVRITPVGAAQTGEAPASGPSPGALIAFGAALLTGGVLGGVALRRRRAAHAGDRPGPTSGAMGGAMPNQPDGHRPQQPSHHPAQQPAAAPAARRGRPLPQAAVAALLLLACLAGIAAIMAGLLAFLSPTVGQR